MFCLCFVLGCLLSWGKVQAFNPWTPLSSFVAAVVLISVGGFSGFYVHNWCNFGVLLLDFGVLVEYMVGMKGGV